MTVDLLSKLQDCSRQQIFLRDDLLEELDTYAVSLVDLALLGLIEVHQPRTSDRKNKKDFLPGVNSYPLSGTTVNLTPGPFPFFLVRLLQFVHNRLPTAFDNRGSRTADVSGMELILKKLKRWCQISPNLSKILLYSHIQEHHELAKDLNSSKTNIFDVEEGSKLLFPDSHIISLVFQKKSLPIVLNEDLAPLCLDATTKLYADVFRKAISKPEVLTQISSRLDRIIANAEIYSSFVSPLERIVPSFFDSLNVLRSLEMIEITPYDEMPSYLDLKQQFLSYLGQKDSYRVCPPYTGPSLAPLLLKVKDESHQNETESETIESVSGKGLSFPERKSTLETSNSNSVLEEERSGVSPEGSSLSVSVSDEVVKGKEEEEFGLHSPSESTAASPSGTSVQPRVSSVFIPGDVSLPPIGGLLRHGLKTSEIHRRVINHEELPSDVGQYYPPTPPPSPRRRVHQPSLLEESHPEHENLVRSLILLDKARRIALTAAARAAYLSKPRKRRGAMKGAVKRPRDEASSDEDELGLNGVLSSVSSGSAPVENEPPFAMVTKLTLIPRAVMPFPFSLCVVPGSLSEEELEASRYKFFGDYSGGRTGLPQPLSHTKEEEDNVILPENARRLKKKPTQGYSPPFFGRNEHLNLPPVGGTPAPLDLNYGLGSGTGTGNTALGVAETASAPSSTVLSSGNAASSSASGAGKIRKRQNTTPTSQVTSAPNKSSRVGSSSIESSPKRNRVYTIAPSTASGRIQPKGMVSQNQSNPNFTNAYDYYSQAASSGADYYQNQPPTMYPMNANNYSNDDSSQYYHESGIGDGSEYNYGLPSVLSLCPTNVSPPLMAQLLVPTPLGNTLIPVAAHLNDTTGLIVCRVLYDGIDGRSGLPMNSDVFPNTSNGPGSKRNADSNNNIESNTHLGGNVAVTYSGDSASASASTEQKTFKSNPEHNDIRTLLQNELEHQMIHQLRNLQSLGPN